MSGKSVAYDPALIKEFAQRLYRQAGMVILTSTAVGTFLGAIAGAAGAGMAGLRGNVGTLALLGIAIGAMAGYLRGRDRAFTLKLEAQTALCQVQIEHNTSGKNG